MAGGISFQTQRAINELDRDYQPPPASPAVGQPPVGQVGERKPSSPAQEAELRRIMLRRQQALAEALRAQSAGQ